MEPERDTEKVWHFDIVVADGFVLIEVAAVVEVIRIANRIGAREVFSWSYHSASGGAVQSRSLAYVDTEVVPEQPVADYVFVIGNSDPDSKDLSMGRLIDRYTFSGSRVFLLAEAATRYINEKGGDGEDFTTHWENAALFRERQGVFDAGNVIASERGSVVTCAGMGAAVDVAIAVIGRHVSNSVQSTVADIMLHERVRAFDSQQNLSDASRTRSGDKELDLCIELMRANVEDPIPISDFARLLGISNRSLERRFKAYLGTTPNAHYREMRLALANNLLRNTSMSVREVGLACGFSNGFSSLYKKTFGITPTELRKKRRQGLVA